jgi:predicted Zn-dependent peptidase
MTIGKELSHIENAQLDDVKKFFAKHYTPCNAILVVAGNVKTEQIKRLAEKWFEPIPAGKKYERNLPEEPEQTEARVTEAHAKVPVSALYKAWRMGGRLDKSYYPIDLLTDVLGTGQSSRLYQSLVKEQQVFSSVSCYHLGSIDDGLVVMDAKLAKGITMQNAETAVNKELEKLLAENISEKELQKVINKTESLMAFEDMSILNRANDLAFYELLGDADLMNKELKRYQAVSLQDMAHFAQKVFKPANSCTLRYFSEK